MRIPALAILLVAFALPAAAADRITLTITITNPPVTSNNLVINSSTRTWTNASSATTIATNLTSVNSATTNLYRQIANNPYSGLTLQLLNTNQIRLVGSLGGALAASASGTWASLVLFTNSGPSTWTALWPMENMVGDTNRTNQASAFVSGISTYSTQAVAATATALSNHVNLTEAQTISGSKNFTGSNSFSGSKWVGGQSSNSWIQHAIITPHPTTFSNHGIAFSTGVGVAPTARIIADTVGRAGLVDANGNPLDLSADPDDRDLLNFITARSIFPNRLPFGSTYSNYWTTTNAFAGKQYFDAGFNATGAALTSSHSTSGTSDNWGATNGVIAGTNMVNGRLDFTSRANTSLANGNNAGVVLGTNTYIRLSGPSAAYVINGFASEHDGSWHIIEAENPTSSLTIANQSGTDPTAANRIVTGTGADVVITNNPAVFEAIYNATAGRWRLKGVWR